MRKRGLTALLALVLTLSMVPMQAWAAPAEAAAIASGPDTLDADELFAGYVERTFHGVQNRREDMLARWGETALSGANLRMYNLLKGKIVQVANGSLSSSSFQFDTAGMGITFTGGRLHGVDVDLVIEALLADFPYELYWFNKSKGYSCTWSYNQNGTVLSIEYKLHVYEDYAVYSADRKEYYIYRPDTAKTGAAAEAAKNAQALVSSCGGLSDYDKLTAYRDYICANSTYNHKAAQVGTSSAGGDPWQLIYVFDNDPSTNVVCEGYAKAFKYLCDLSEFSDDIACYIVTGDTAGPHMWNIVRINGQSYLADITNCDADNIKPLDALFLAGDPHGAANGYTIHVPRYEVGSGHHVAAYDISYTYDTRTIRLYGADVLTLAAAGYTPADIPSPPSTPSEPSAPDFTDLAPNAFYLDAVNWAVANHITTGTTTTSFSPGRTCTHGEILTFLWRAAGEPESGAQPPIPLDGDEFYYEAARWAAELGAVGPDFSPDAPCTRLSAMFYIWYAFGTPDPEGRNPFSDVPMDAPGAQAAMWAMDHGITTGTTDTTFSPDKICSRGEIVTFLHRAYE